MTILSATSFACWLFLTLLACACQGLQTLHHESPALGRRFFLATIPSVALLSLPVTNQAQAAAGLQFRTAASGMQWADAKVGSGSPRHLGEVTAVDYVLSTTGARYGSKIYSTQGDPNAAVGSSGFSAGAPYRWTLGDGSTIQGLELAILGDNAGMPAMLPGGIRRVILPSNLAYASLVKKPNAKCQSSIGPVPPPSTAFEGFQRFKNIYCNPDRQYQPDVVMDIKLYGRRQ
mmetsp:Transcript_15690/g.29702  ORF Transcript_15690/g.29702 Transcript_15690/m.29702 type:complete len:232 (-) Transcript_15690:36-731(-)|eukprot:scaffold36476_cov252-Amphora_coffeaeformis.AAC.7